MADAGKSPEAASSPPAPADVPASSAAPPTVTADATEPAVQHTEADPEGNPPANPPGILPASHWEALEPEDVLDDRDSGFSDLASSTASLSNSILQYRTVLGRTYHSEIGRAEGWTPNDERHNETMDLHHHQCTLLLGEKLYLAPLKKDIKKVVDIGTGTGIWAIDFADEFPNTEVIGTDLSPIQPSWVPPNVQYQLDDANLDFTWAEDTFDYIHLRCMLGTIIDWPRLYREAFRCCKPGGWIEHHEEAAEFHCDTGGIPEDSAMGQWGKVFDQGGNKFGRTFRVVQDDLQRKGMEEAGFVDIVVKDYKCPIGDWPKDPKQKETGMFAKIALESDIEGFIQYIWGQVMGWTPEEIQVYLAHLRRQLKDNSIHSWYPHRVVYARKPE